MPYFMRDEVRRITLGWPTGQDRYSCGFAWCGANIPSCSDPSDIGGVSVNDVADVVGCATQDGVESGRVLVERRRVVSVQRDVVLNIRRHQADDLAGQRYDLSGLVAILAEIFVDRLRQDFECFLPIRQRCPLWSPHRVR